jgi:NhaP-type Na+/H+ or K+/H+ antiporter
MASNAFIAFFAGLGAGMWVYSKFSRRATANDFKKTITPALMAFIFVFIGVQILLTSIFG